MFGIDFNHFIYHFGNYYYASNILIFLIINKFSIAQDLKENPVVLNNGGTVVVKITTQADGKVAWVTCMLHFL